MSVVETFPRPVRRLDPVFVPMPDGARLAATVWLPEDAEAHPVPAVLEMIPYRRRDGTVFRDHLMHPYVAGHGFACCRVDLRGSGDSDGILADEYTDKEHDDACAVIAWLAAQPWCSGAVGMTGISWGGFNALQVAARRPPALKAIITLCASDDRYADDVHYYGGGLLTEEPLWSAFMLALSALPPDPQIVGSRWRDMWRQRLEAATCLSATWLSHQRRDAYWRRGSACEDFAAIEVPVLAVSGWDDTYSNAVPRLLAGLLGPAKGILGPWTHAYPFLGEPGPAIGYLQEAIRWWRHWLAGVDTGIMEEPKLAAWISEPHAPQPSYADHPGRFVGEPAWPSPNVRERVLHLNEGRLAAEPAPGRAMVLRSPVTAGRDCGRYGGYGGSVPDMALDQRREDGLGLAFDTPPLDEGFEILGAAAVEMTATADAPQALLVARLCDVAADGTSTLITWGALNLAHRGGSADPEPLVPGEPFTARLVLNDVGRRVAAGSRLRLVLTTQHWPILWPSPAMPTIRIEPGACRLRLPVRVAPPGDAPVRFAEAETSPPVPFEALRPEAHRREVAVDVGSGTQSIVLTSDHGRQRLTDRDITIAAHSREAFTIRDGDPLSAAVEADWTLATASGGADVETRSHVRLTADAHRFHLAWRLEAREAGEIVFERAEETWIDRDNL